MTIQAHDFSRPPSLHPDTRAKLVRWVTRANMQLAETISGFGLPTTIDFDDCLTTWPIDSLQQWSDTTLAFRVMMADSSALSIIGLPNQLAQVLIGTLLGEQLAEWPVDRELTPGEESVGEFVIARIADSLNNAWPADSSLEVKVREREQNLRRSRAFKFQEPLVICRSIVKTPLGTAPWCWMLAQGFVTHLFSTSRHNGTQSAPSPRQQLESMARDMTTQVTVRLGGVQLSAPQLSELRVGDLVVLGQKTTEPLRAIVSGKPRFLGWPGRVGNRQAFEIASDGTKRDHADQAAGPAYVTVNH